MSTYFAPNCRSLAVKNKMQLMNYLSNNGSVRFGKFPLGVAYFASEILVWIIPSGTELFCKRDRERDSKEIQ